MWNALDLGQWRFYIVRREQLEEYGAKTVSLSTIATLAARNDASVLGAEEFRRRALSMIDEITSRRAETDGQAVADGRQHEGATSGS